MSELWKISLVKARKEFKEFYEELSFYQAATSEGVAYVVTFLISDKASHVSGIAITIDGCLNTGL
jgi:hypothetical protein